MHRLDAKSNILLMFVNHFFTIIAEIRVTY